MTRRELGTARDVCRVESVNSAHALVSSEAGISDSQARQVRSGASVAASPRRSRNFGRFNAEGRRERAFGQAQHFPLRRD